ncbi:hypothetical protein ACFQZZ_17010 [Nocardia sp. GCM10030253]|uniref:hypothetical protein n=1 Tax=Nocardia sp. GCM10030253 TaxID=3273404 RepID=UPI00363AC1B5
MVDDSTLADETPHPMGEQNGDFLGDWIAVPTADKDGLIEALGLVDSRAVTMRAGWEASGSDGCVYLTPELDDWTLIFGYVLPDGYAVESVRALLNELSRRFGSAHWYYNDYGYTGWAMAERGELVRLYVSGDSPDADSVVGPPTRAEEDLQLLLLVNDDEDDEDNDGRPNYDATMLAERASVDPTAVGPETRVRGQGRVAVQPSTDA